MGAEGGKGAITFAISKLFPNLRDRLNFSASSARRFGREVFRLRYSASSTARTLLPLLRTYSLVRASVHVESRETGDLSFSPARTKGRKRNKYLYSLIPTEREDGNEREKGKREGWGEGRRDANKGQIIRSTGILGARNRRSLRSGVEISNPILVDISLATFDTYKRLLNIITIII